MATRAHCYFVEIFPALTAAKLVERIEKLGYQASARAKHGDPGEYFDVTVWVDQQGPIRSPLAVGHDLAEHLPAWPVSFNGYDD